jgi:hypothetical protein
LPVVYDSIDQAWKDGAKHLILGTEEFDRFGTTPWSHRNGIHAIRELTEVVAQQLQSLKHNNSNHRIADVPFVLQVELVVNYRRPRQEHWISIWKQLARRIRRQGKDELEYREFLCQDNPDEILRLWEYLDSVANPLGLVNAFLQELLGPTTTTETKYRAVISKVHLMDMMGITKSGLDISHAIACQVLGAKPCPNGWLIMSDQKIDPRVSVSTEKSSNNSVNNNQTGVAILQNKRSGHPGLLPAQLDDMEFLFLLRDCQYRSALEEFQRKDALAIHHGETMWESCRRETATGSWNATSTDDMLELLRDQVGCGSGRLSATLIRKRRQTTTDTLNKLNLISRHATHAQRKTVETNAIHSEENLYQTVKIQSEILLVLGGTFICTRYRKSRRRRPM